MALKARNPAAVRLLLGWLGVAGATVGGVMALGLTSLAPLTGVAVVAQGVAAMMAAKRGQERLGWIILLAPLALLLSLAALIYVLYLLG